MSITWNTGAAAERARHNLKLKKNKKIKSKHNSLLNYFIHDDRDLAPGYIRSCEKFLDGLRKKGYRLQARKRSSLTGLKL